MPATSKAQQRYMGMLYGNPEMRKKAGVSKKVAKDFASTKHKGLPERKESMNFTEFCEALREPIYHKEGAIPRCPPGYVYNRDRQECIPKTEKDKITGRLNQKDQNYGDASYRVYGSHGQNGAPPAIEVPFVDDGERPPS